MSFAHWSNPIITFKKAAQNLIFLLQQMIE